jgi:HEAT repeat protein
MINPRSAAVALAVLVSLAGCSSSRSPGGLVRQASPLPAPEEVARYRDPLAVSSLREQAVDLIVGFASSDSAELRTNALEALIPTPGRLEPICSTALRDPNPAVRTAAVIMVGRASLVRLAAAVRPLVQDRSGYVQAAAVYSLTRLKQPVDPTVIGQLVLHAPDPRLRAHAAFLIGEMGERSALPMLREAARDNISRSSMPEVKLLQIQLAEAMVKLGDDQQLEVIRAALYPSRPEDLEVTALAVQCIGELRDKSATDELIYLTALKDHQGNRMPAEIRLAAAASLARLGLDKGSFIADEFIASPMPPLRAQAAFVYGEIGHQADLAKLARLMNDADPRVRLAAAAATLKATNRLR